MSVARPDIFIPGYKPEQIKSPYDEGSWVYDLKLLPPHLLEVARGLRVLLKENQGWRLEGLKPPYQEKTEAPYIQSLLAVFRAKNPPVETIPNFFYGYTKIVQLLQCFEDNHNFSGSASVNPLDQQVTHFINKVGPFSISPEDSAHYSLQNFSTSSPFIAVSREEGSHVDHRLMVPDRIMFRLRIVDQLKQSQSDFKGGREKETALSTQITNLQGELSTRRIKNNHLLERIEALQQTPPPFKL